MREESGKKSVPGLVHLGSPLAHGVVLSDQEHHLKPSDVTSTTLDPTMFPSEIVSNEAVSNEIVSTETEPNQTQSNQTQSHQTVPKKTVAKNIKKENIKNKSWQHFY